MEKTSLGPLKTARRPSWPDFYILDKLLVDMILSSEFLFDFDVFSDYQHRFHHCDEEGAAELFGIRFIGKYSHKKLKDLYDQYELDCKQTKKVCSYSSGSHANFEIHSKLRLLSFQPNYGGDRVCAAGRDLETQFPCFQRGSRLPPSTTNSEGRKGGRGLGTINTDYKIIIWAKWTTTRTVFRTDGIALETLLRASSSTTSPGCYPLRYWMMVTQPAVPSRPRTPPLAKATMAVQLRSLQRGRVILA